VLRRYLLAGLLPAVCAGGGWNQPGPTAGRRTGAGTAMRSRLLRGGMWGYSRDVTAGSGHHGQMGTALVRRRSGSLLVLWFRLVMPGDGA
jgi:hypothetical protein